MFCVNCGNELSQYDYFCTNCGNKVESKKESIEVKRILTKSKKTIPVICLAILVLLFLTMYFSFFSKSEEERIAVMAAQNLKDTLAYPETLELYRVLVIFYRREEKEGDIKGVYLDYASEEPKGFPLREEIYYHYDKESDSFSCISETTDIITDSEFRDFVEEATVEFLTFELAYKDGAYVEFESEKILERLE